MKATANNQQIEKRQSKRGNRKQLTGVVVSTKNAKTISVSVTKYAQHPLYGKTLKESKKFAVHDETSLAQVGDSVRIMETRPLSKTKKFRLVKVLKSLKEGK